MSEEGWIKLAEIGASVLVSLLAFLKVALKFWLTAKKQENEHRAALEAENLKLRKENIDIGFSQLKEADSFIKQSLIEISKQLRDTTAATVAYGRKLMDIQRTTTEKIDLSMQKIDAATTRIEALEVKVKSVVTDIGEGKVRVSGPKF